MASGGGKRHGRGRGGDDGTSEKLSRVNWRAKYMQAKDELALATYEALKWKEKFHEEKQRRRALAKSLLDSMALHDRGRSPTDTRPSSSVFSDVDHIESILSPTLSSFDFDDDDDESGSGDDDDDDAGGGGLSGGEGAHSYRSSTGSCLSPTGTASAANHVDALRDAPAARHGTELRNSVRPNRSSTTGSLRDSIRLSLARRDSGTSAATAVQTMPPQSLIYRMMYSKPSARDLWHSRSSQQPSSSSTLSSASLSARHGSKFSTIARSLMVSMHLRKERVFENFFVVGLTVGTAERAHAAKNAASGFVGYWKPRVLFQYPHKPAGGVPDGAVADFCFPQGVPITKCRPHQAAALNGAVVSLWSTDAEQLHKHTLDPFRTSGYTFQLTGAKGEVLHGFCVAVLGDLIERPEPRQTASTTAMGDVSSGSNSSSAQPTTTASKPLSPRVDWSRASCPAVTRLSTDDSYLHQPSKVKRESVKCGADSTDTAPSLLAPLCYCFTSKFPFYRLHYTLLRMIVENEVRQRLRPNVGDTATADDEEVEVLLRPPLPLRVQFAICHRENRDASGTKASSALPTTAGLGSIASAVHVSVDNRVVLSEDATLVHTSAPPSPSPARFLTTPMTTTTTAAATVTHSIAKPTRLRKCHSSDDIGAIVASNSCIVEKPIVKAITSTCPDEYAQLLQVGDVLEAIDGIATASIGFDGAMELLRKCDRAVKLRFLRSSAKRSPQKATREAVPRFLSASSVDILHRAHGMSIGDPGQWATTRFPHFDVEYQLPKRNADRWTVGVVLRCLRPESVVMILAHLLLEKQVAIVGESPTRVTAVCTAFMLLLAPFQWQSTYIPMLPSSLLDFLHSPVPFLAGCHPLASTDEWPDVCFYNIDADTITTPAGTEHLDATSFPHGVEFCRLLYGARERFSALRPSSKPWHELSDDEDKIVTLTLQEAEIFLRDLCFDVSSFDLTPRSGQSFYDCLQEEVAKELRKSHFEEYLEEFSQTQLFCQYCESVLKPEQQDH